jgi:hypothetical protein
LIEHLLFMDYIKIVSINSSIRLKLEVGT